MKEEMLEFIEENIQAMKILQESKYTCLEIKLKADGVIAAFKNMKEFIETIEDAE
jgi:hypothetical protein